jgi:hypothetical protein
MCAQDGLEYPESSHRDVPHAAGWLEPTRRRRPQSLWATVLPPHVVTGPIRGDTNGAAFTLGVAADRRSSAPPPQPFLVVCVGLVCSVGCPRGCSNSLTAHSK